MGVHGAYDPDDDDHKKDLEASSKKKIKDWDCPSCNANNPVGEQMRDGEETICNYCGTTFLVKITDEGKLKLKEM
jgi:hypothetical protein